MNATFNTFNALQLMRKHSNRNGSIAKAVNTVNPFWHAEVMFLRLRLLLIEPFPVIEEIMSDIEGLVRSGHPTAVPVAILTGIEVLTKGGSIKMDIERAYKLSRMVDERFVREYMVMANAIGKGKLVSDTLREIIKFNNVAVSNLYKRYQKDDEILPRWMPNQCRTLTKVRW